MHAVGLHATDSPQSVYCIMCQPALYGRKSTILICTRCFAKIESLTGGREEKRVSSTAYATAAAAAAVILSPCQIMGIWSAREGILAGGQEDESTPCAAISQPPSSSSLPASTAPRFGDLVRAGRVHSHRRSAATEAAASHIGMKHWKTACKSVFFPIDISARLKMAGLELLLFLFLCIKKPKFGHIKL